MRNETRSFLEHGLSILFLIVIAVGVGIGVWMFHFGRTTKACKACKYEVARQEKLDQKNCEWYVRHAQQVEQAECGMHSCWIRNCKPVQTIYMLAWQLAKKENAVNLSTLAQAMQLPSMGVHLDRVMAIEKFFKKVLKLNYDEYITARFCDKDNRHMRNVILANVLNVLLYPTNIKNAAILFRRLHHENTADVRWKYRDRRNSVKKFLLGAFYNRRKVNNADSPPYRSIYPGDIFYACESFEKQKLKLEKGMLRGLATVMAANPENQKRMLRAYWAIKNSKYTFENIKVIEIMMLLFYAEWLEFRARFPGATYPVYSKKRKVKK